MDSTIYFYRLLGKIINDGYNTFHEMVQNYPNGMVKEMIKRFGQDFQDLLDIEGVHQVKYLVNMKKIEIEASPLGYQDVSIF